MKFLAPILCATLLLTVTTSCETTGDPTTGGYWGYSTTKNEQRRQVLRDDLAIVEQDNREKQKERSRLQADLNRKKNDLARAQQRRRSLNDQPIANPGQSKATDSEIASIQSDIRVLEARINGMSTL